MPKIDNLPKAAPGGAHPGSRFRMTDPVDQQVAAWKPKGDRFCKWRRYPQKSAPADHGGPQGEL